MQTLFETKDVVAVATGMPVAGGNVVVSFPARTDRQGLHRKGFGQDFFKKKGISAVLVKAEWNHWFQVSELEDLAGAIAEHCRPYRRLVTYGSSMGGYAAARLAGLLDANAALCISPQFSIDQAKVPKERRWRDDASRIDFLFDDMGSALRRTTEVTIVYDSLTPDRLHAELYAAANRNVHLLPIPFSGHPSGAFLKDSGILSKMVSQFISSGLDVREWRREVRSLRPTTALYWSNLAVAASRSRPKLALAAVDRALSLQPDNPSVIMPCARTYDRLGMSKRAVALLDHAISLRPDVQKLYELKRQFSPRQDVEASSERVG